VVNQPLVNQPLVNQPLVNQPLVEEHFEAQLDLVEQSLLPLTAPGADLADEHSVFVEHLLAQSDLPLTAPGAALAASAQQPDFFSPTAPGAAALVAEHSVLAEQHSAFLAPTAPGAEVWVLLHAARRATIESEAMVVIFIKQSPCNSLQSPNLRPRTFGVPGSGLAWTTRNARD
jgi:hypothetical protein